MVSKCRNSPMRPRRASERSYRMQVPATGRYYGAGVEPARYPRELHGCANRRRHPDIIVFYMAMATQFPVLADKFMQLFRNIRAKHPDVPVVPAFMSKVNDAKKWRTSAIS